MIEQRCLGIRVLLLGGKGLVGGEKRSQCLDCSYLTNETFSVSIEQLISFTLSFSPVSIDNNVEMLWSENKLSHLKQQIRLGLLECVFVRRL